MQESNLVLGRRSFRAAMFQYDPAEEIVRRKGQMRKGCEQRNPRMLEC